VIDNVRALDHLDFSDEELAQIEQILGEQTPIDWSAR
jgi:L-glyceraldehyde 3-phosphate reductase